VPENVYHRTRMYVSLVTSKCWSPRFCCDT
jgi:hypothetical protein